MSPEALEIAVAAVRKQQQGQKTVTGTPTSIWMHGPGGVLSSYGIEQPVISTRVKPTGILSALRAYPSVLTDPLFAYITGFLADTGTDPANKCDDCMVAGIKKVCHQVAQFGRYCRETQEIDINRVGERINRMEADDLYLVNPCSTGTY